MLQNIKELLYTYFPSLKPKTKVKPKHQEIYSKLESFVWHPPLEENSIVKYLRNKGFVKQSAVAVGASHNTFQYFTLSDKGRDMRNYLQRLYGGLNPTG